MLFMYKAMEKKELIRFAKNSVIGALCKELNNLEYRYLIRKFEIPPNCKVEFNMGDRSQNIKWSSEEEFKDIDVRLFTHYLQTPLTVIGNLIVKKNFKIVSTYENVKFDLIIEFWFNFERPFYTFNILDSENLIIKKYIEQVELNNKKADNISLNDDKALFGGKHHADFFTSIIRKQRSSVNIEFNDGNDFDFLDDLTRCTIDLKSFIGELNLLKPYLTHYLAQPLYNNGKVVYQHFQTFIDERFFSICGLIYELLYNFWDRIGDLLAPFLTPQIQKRNIYFSTVIKGIKSPYSESLNYLWLKNFHDTDYLTLNGIRKEIVHYKNIASKFQEVYSKNIQDERKLIKLQADKEQLIDYFEKQLKLLHIGFEKSMFLIDEIQ